MRKDWKYILYLSIFVGIYLLVKLSGPKRHDWSITLAHEDKDPYGTYVLSELINDHNKNLEVEHSYKTLYEEIDSNATSSNLLILATNFSAGSEDVDRLLDHISKGNAALISANYFTGKLADTLKLVSNDFLFQSAADKGINDSISLRFVNPNLDIARRFNYSQNNIHNYFEDFDSLLASVTARNEFDQPVTLHIQWGKGFLILNSTPLAFTNINVLNGANREFVSGTLSYLPPRPILWTEHYHLGRMEPQSILRFILTTEALRWAYYVSVLTLLLFIIFEAKRKQRIIPVIKPLANTSLEFVATIGNLYFHRGDHKNLAEKIIAFFLEQLRSRYWLESAIHNHNLKMIAQKTGNDELTTASLFGRIQNIQQRTSISSEELISLNNEIEKFLNTRKHG